MIMLQNNPGDYETSTRSLQKHRQESKSKQITEAQNVLLASESKLLRIISKESNANEVCWQASSINSDQRDD